MGGKDHRVLLYFTSVTFTRRRGLITSVWAHLGTVELMVMRRGAWVGSRTRRVWACGPWVEVGTEFWDWWMQRQKIPLRLNVSQVQWALRYWQPRQTTSQKRWLEYIWSHSMVGRLRLSRHCPVPRELPVCLERWDLDTCKHQSCGEAVNDKYQGNSLDHRYLMFGFDKMSREVEQILGVAGGIY